MDIILDTSALLSGKLSGIPPGENRFLISDLARDEVKKGPPSRSLENLIRSGLIVSSRYDTEAAIEAASRTGDLEKLSKADLSVIALAMSSENPLVLTDDFRVQNVLRSIGIKFEPAGEIGDRSIRETWEWTYRCRGCGRYFEDLVPDCPICGSELKKTPKRIRSEE